MPQSTTTRLDPLPPILLDGSLNLLTGAPGVGKTALLASLAVQFRDCSPIFGYTPNLVAGLGIVTTDRSWHKSTGHWFRLAGYPDIPHYSIADDRQFDIKRLRVRGSKIGLLANCLDHLNLPPGSLVFVDPVSIFLGGRLNDYDACLAACLEVRNLLTARGLTLLGMCHSSKQKADPHDRYLRLQDRIVGSTALVGYADTSMYLGSPEELGVPFYTFYWHPHHAKAESFRLQHTSSGLFVPFSGTDPQTTSTLLDIFPDPATVLTFNDLERRLREAKIDLSRRSIFRGLDVLLERNEIEKIGRGKYRRLRAKVLEIV